MACATACTCLLPLLLPLAAAAAAAATGVRCQLAVQEAEEEGSLTVVYGVSRSCGCCRLLQLPAAGGSRRLHSECAPAAACGLSNATNAANVTEAAACSDSDFCLQLPAAGSRNLTCFVGSRATVFGIDYSGSNFDTFGPCDVCASHYVLGLSFQLCASDCPNGSSGGIVADIAGALGGSSSCCSESLCNASWRPAPAAAAAVAVAGVALLAVAFAAGRCQ